MTAEIQQDQAVRRYTGLSTDVKPILGLVDLKYEFYETDTKNLYKWYGEDWVLISINGALPSTIIDQHNVGMDREVLESILDELKILNTYMALAHGERITVEDTEENL